MGRSGIGILGMLKEIETERDAIAAAENMLTHTRHLVAIIKGAIEHFASQYTGDLRSDSLEFDEILDLLRIGGLCLALKAVLSLHGDCCC